MLLVKHVTSVPYPSEYLVTITLFFPQCSHGGSVSWKGQETSVHLFIKKGIRTGMGREFCLQQRSSQMTKNYDIVQIVERSNNNK